MAQTPYRITPTLGPGLRQTDTQFHWDTIGDAAGTGGPSYALGTKVIGNDGHEFVFVRNGAAALAADARVNLTEGTWLATANASGTHQAPVAVAANAYFHARKFVL